MLSSSIEKKLTFLTLVVIAPAIVLLVIGERIVSGQLARVVSGISSLNLIEQIWIKSENINSVSDDSVSNFERYLQAYSENVPDAAATKSEIAERWQVVNDSELKTTKRLLTAQKLTEDIANDSALASILSDVSTDLAMVAFDRVPELSYRLETFVRLTERLQAKAELGNNDVMAFLVNAGQFKAVSDHISRNTRKPFKRICL